ncbi:hypothetical protein [Actinophytocola xanthii]|uniref:hypothetical protein n=1 Tax=Actinophytocola xanthii TaxID=1912961 RepID=UPI0011782944|nr:hypothetical protein [Actinophytocola xanthii]
MSQESPSDLEMPFRVTNLDAQPHLYDTVSVIDDYASDPAVFFRAAQAVSGVIEPVIGSTYDKLTEGCLTWSRVEADARDPSGVDPKNLPVHPPVTEVRYPELHPARLNWMQMRFGAGWIAPENMAAHEYENDFIPFQVYTENCAYRVAEHLARYRAVFLKAGEDIARLMDGLTARFASPPSREAPGADFDLLSIVVTALVTAVATVISGTPTTAVALGVVATEALGEAVKTAEPKKVVIEGHTHLRDSARQFLDAVDSIEREVAEAIIQLRDHLRIELDRIRELRRHEVIPGSGRTSEAVPRFPEYMVDF